MAEETLAPPVPGMAPSPSKKGLFKPKAPPPMPDISGMTEHLNTMAARLRISEQRYSEMRKKMLFVEQNMLSNHKRAMTEIKSVQSDILEIKRTIQAVEDKIIIIIKELRLTARKEDVDVMKRYLELWNPVKFVSHDQVIKIIDEKLDQSEEIKPPNYDSPT